MDGPNTTQTLNHAAEVAELKNKLNEAQAPRFDSADFIARLEKHELVSSRAVQISLHHRPPTRRVGSS